MYRWEQMSAEQRNSVVAMCLGEDPSSPLPYSEDISVAFDLVEHMCVQKLDPEENPFRLYRGHNGSFYADFNFANNRSYGFGKTAPEAICRAVLDAFDLSD